MEQAAGHRDQQSHTCMSSSAGPQELAASLEVMVLGLFYTISETSGLPGLVL